jgi:hypothetical protein
VKHIEVLSQFFTGCYEVVFLPLLHLTVVLNFSPPFGVGPDPNSPKTLIQGFARIYRGLGVSAARSIITHGMLWTFVDAISDWIDRRTRYLNDSVSPIS